MKNSFNKIGFMGLGNMAQALISGWIRQGGSPSTLVGFDTDVQKRRKIASRFKIKTVENNLELIKQTQVLVLAVKPQDAKLLLQEIGAHLSKHLIISIAAGLDCQSILKSLNHQGRRKGLQSRARKPLFSNHSPKIIRAMPNNPALIGQGMAGLFSPQPLSSSERKIVESIFGAGGEWVWVKKEDQLDAVTGLSGSGPAYVYRFVLALARAGEKVGLPAKLAYRLALKTTVGGALTLEQTQEDPVELIRKVASPKGTTLAGLDVLDQTQFDRVIEKTVAAATRRATEIRKELRNI